jgi:hypothetical protein
MSDITDLSDKEQIDREVNRLVNIGINKFINRFNVTIVDTPEPVVEIDPEYGVDKEFLDVPVLYETRGKPLERKTFRELARIIKKHDRIYYRNNSNQEEGPDHKGFELNRKITHENLKAFFKKLGYRTTTFGARGDPTYNCVAI